MKLRNNQTGQVENFCIDKDQICSCDRAFVYDSLKQLQEAGWEDYEELKDHYFIEMNGEISIVECLEYRSDFIDNKVVPQLKQIGNYFETKEQAEKAVEKLKAWKRLKDKEFKFYGWNKGSLLKGTPNNITFACDDTRMWAWEDIQDDLDILFGGEE